MATMAKPTRCERCGRENDPSFTFCLDCGASLLAPAPPRATPPSCIACGATLQPNFKFCGHCGAPLPKAAGGPTGTGFHPVVQVPPAAAPDARPAPPPLPSRGTVALDAPPVASPRLTAVRSDGHPGAVFPLDRAELVCGRGDVAVRLADDPTVSPRHARFTTRDGTLRVEDLGSVNGTFVRIREPRTLGAGDELRVGRQRLRLEPLPAPPAPDAHGTRAWGCAGGGARVRLSQLLEGGGVGEIFPLREGENDLGREAGDATFPGDRYVSARHARLEVTGGAVRLTDLGSSNGTFVRLSGPATLAPGDELLVGGQLLRVEA
jgi:pSer/pThr/pTyr-binding forkhead associated (FHA) protein